jgi:hypothetical protein
MVEKENQAKEVLLVKENKEQEKDKKIIEREREKDNVMTVALLGLPDSPLKAAIEKLFQNTYNVEINKQVFGLQKKIEKIREEFIYLFSKIARDEKKTYSDATNRKRFNPLGQIELSNLINSIGNEEVNLKTKPIKMEVSDDLSSSEMFILEKFKIAEFEIKEEAK